jgi:tRNA splicing endonuclease
LVITNGSRYIVDFSTNLYKEYYSLNYDQIEQSKLITARFYLTEYDIASLQYSDRIILYLNGTNVLCRVNKIKDYNPTEDMTTVVELITLVS